MVITDTGAVMTKRYFHAIDILILKGQIKGLRSFAMNYDLNYLSLLAARKEPTKHILKPEWLPILVTDFYVSADYLLTGRGRIFTKEVKVEEPQPKKRTARSQKTATV